jgi:hypothetical protein
VQGRQLGLHLFQVAWQLMGLDAVCGLIFH